MALRDTVLINGYDIMFDDVNLSSDDFNPFFFKTDLIGYLDRLRKTGWDIYLYWPFLNNVYIYRIPVFTGIVAKYGTGALRTILLNRKTVINNRLKDYVQIIELGDQILSNLLDYTKFSPASFAIMDTDRNFGLPIARYTAEEIFGFNEPPVIDPNTIYIHLTSSYQYPYFDYFPETQIFFSGPTRRERITLINQIKQQYPGYNIIEVWPIVFRYPRKYQKANVNFIPDFGRPDLDILPNVRHYTFTVLK